MTYDGHDRTPPTPEKNAAIEKFAQEMFQSGILIDTGGILPIDQGAKVKLVSGKFTATDGPFPETKELIVGYAIVSVKSKEEAVEVARRFMSIAGDGEGEIRQLIGPADGPPPAA
jgi:hypothetical protein